MSKPANFFPAIPAGALGGTILGIAGFLYFLTYSGNYGCFPLIDRLFNGVGYESCGPFGIVTGILLGSLLGTLLLRYLRIQKIGWLSTLLLLGAFIIPLIGVLWFFRNTILDDQSNLLFVAPIIAGFILMSLITSTIIVLLIELIQWLTKMSVLFFERKK